MFTFTFSSMIGYQKILSTVPCAIYTAQACLSAITRKDISGERAFTLILFLEVNGKKNGDSEWQSINIEINLS